MSAFLLLGEPTSVLPLAQRRSVLGLAQHMCDRGTAVVAVLHDLNRAARHTERVAGLKGARLVCLVTPQQVLQPTGLRQVFGAEGAAVSGGRGSRPVSVVPGLALAHAKAPDGFEKPRSGPLL